MGIDEKTLLRSLRDPLAWEAPALGGLDAIVAAMEKVQAEDDAAAAWCAVIFCGTPASWPKRLQRTSGARTAGMVRQLLGRIPALLASTPADAHHVTSMALAVSEALDPKEYGPDHVTHLRAQALREHAYVLAFLGRYAEAAKFAASSEEAFGQVQATNFDLARLALVKASLLRKRKRREEAAALAHEAADLFLSIGDRKRHVQARMTAAALLVEAGAAERALEAWTPVQDDPELDATGALRVAHNMAACLCDLGRHAEAVALFENCVAGFEKLGRPMERTLSRWYLGNALLGTDREREGITALHAASDELAEMDDRVDGSLATLDLADPLVTNGEPPQVPMIYGAIFTLLTNGIVDESMLAALSRKRATFLPSASVG